MVQDPTRRAQAALMRSRHLTLVPRTSTSDPAPDPLIARAIGLVVERFTDDSTLIEVRPLPSRIHVAARVCDVRGEYVAVCALGEEWVYQSASEGRLDEVEALTRQALGQAWAGQQG